MQNVMPYLLLHFFLTKTKKKTLRFYLVIWNSYRCCKLPVKSINFDRALKILIDSAFVMKLLIQFFFLTDLKVNATIKMIIMALIIRPMNSLSFSYVGWNRPKSLLLGAAASQVLRLETKGGVIEELSVKRVFTCIAINIFILNDLLSLSFSPLWTGGNVKF